jgi:hypothetical protein
MKKYNKNTLFIARLLLAALLLQNCGGYQNFIMEPQGSAKEALEAKGMSLKELPATINLSDLGSEGSIINGYGRYNYFGGAVSSAGDVNGDGVDDVIMGTLFGGAPSQAITDRSTSYIIYGSNNMPSVINASTLALTGRGVMLVGRGGAGMVVSRAGDVNGDGIDDVIIGAPFYEGNSQTGFSSRSYILYGNNSLPSGINLYSLNYGVMGVTILGGGGFGYSVSGAGDVNGDGIDDVIIGVPKGYTDAGHSYIVYGSDKLPSPINLTYLGNGGVTINGDDTVGVNHVGSSVSGAGDVNGDGIDDVIIAAFNQKMQVSSSYIVYGNNSLPSTIYLSSLGSRGVTINGIGRGTYSVSGAGDVNGDGIDDVIMGNPETNNTVGRSYIIYGSNQLPSTITLPLIPGQGVTMYGIHELGQSGWSVSGAGDVNGDGKDDVIIGAPTENSFAGRSYIVYGSDQLPSSINFPLLPGQGVTINGNHSRESKSGWSVSGGGDVNNDGVDDVIIGSPYYYANNIAGAGYIIYGSPSNQTSITSNILSSAKRLCNNLAAWWHTEIKETNIDTADKAYVQSMLRLKDKCQAILKEAANETEDKWYAYSIEDMIEDIDAVLQNGKGIDKYTLRSFKRRLAGIQKDFLAPAVELSPEQKATLKSIAALSNASFKEPKEQLYMLATDVVNSLPSYAANSIPALP